MHRLARRTNNIRLILNPIVRSYVDPSDVNREKNLEKAKGQYERARKFREATDWDKLEKIQRELMGPKTEDEIDFRSLSDEQLEQVLTLQQEALEHFNKPPEQEKPKTQDKMLSMFEEDVNTNQIPKPIHYYRAIYKHLKKNMSNDKDNSFQLTKKMVRNQFDKNKNITERGALDLAINKAASYLHTQRAWSLDNDKSSPLERHSDDLSIDDKEEFENAELEKGKENLEGSPEYWNQYFQQIGSEDEKYCDFEVFKNFMYAYNKNMNTKVCVVGCGMSTVGTSLLAMKKSRDVLQVDFSEVAIKHQSNIHKNVPGMRFKQMNLLEDYLPESSFDLIFDKGLFDTVLSCDSGEEDITTLERNVWMALKGKGTYFLVSVTPIDGIRTMFCMHDWGIVKLASYNMETFELTDGMTEEEEDEDYETNVDEALLNPQVHFYAITKPDLL